MSQVSDSVPYHGDGAVFGQVTLSQNVNGQIIHDSQSFNRVVQVPSIRSSQEWRLSTSVQAVVAMPLWCALRKLQY